MGKRGENIYKRKIGSTDGTSFGKLKTQYVELTGGTVTGNAATGANSIVTVSGATEFTGTLTTTNTTGAGNFKVNAPLAVRGTLTTYTSATNTWTGTGKVTLGHGDDNASDVHVAAYQDYQTLGAMNVEFTNKTVILPGSSSGTAYRYDYTIAAGRTWELSYQDYDSSSGWDWAALQLGDQSTACAHLIVSAGAKLIVNGDVDMTSINGTNGYTFIDGTEADANSVTIRGTITLANDAYAATQLNYLPIGAYIVTCAGQHIGVGSTVNDEILVLRYTPGASGTDTLRIYNASNQGGSVIFMEGVTASGHATNKYFYVELSNFNLNNGELSSSDPLSGLWSKDYLSIDAGSRGAADAGDYSWSVTKTDSSVDSGNFTILEDIDSTITP